MRLEERLNLYRKSYSLSQGRIKFEKPQKMPRALYCVGSGNGAALSGVFIDTVGPDTKMVAASGMLLLLSGMILASSGEEGYVWRGMGISASVFVIIMISELWKNRSCHSMEIEQAAYYSLRQIYVARMVLFGLVDVFLLIAFCNIMTIGLRIEFTKGKTTEFRAFRND